MCWPSQKNADDGKRNLPLDPIKRGNSINLWSAEDCVWRPWRSNNFSVIYLQPTALSPLFLSISPSSPLSLAAASGPCNRNVPKSSVEWARLIWKFKQLKQQQRRQRRQRKWKATSWKACCCPTVTLVRHSVPGPTAWWIALIPLVSDFFIDRFLRNSSRFLHGVNLMKLLCCLSMLRFAERHFSNAHTRTHSR